MGIEAALTETATIVRRASGTPDAQGNPVTTSTSAAVACRLAQSSTTDGAATDAERRSSTLRLYLLPDVTIDGNDQVVKDGRTFEVEGSPYLASTPRGPHHWEVTLREVSP